MGLTTDPNDPRLRVVDDKGQQSAYLVLSEEERAKGFVRPVRRTYIHVGKAGPTYPLRDLTEEEQQRFGQDYIKFEEYPTEFAPRTGRLWSQADLDAIGKGCGTETTMGQAIAETYARDPRFYGATYCCRCQRHFPVSEFVWSDDPSQTVGT